MNIEHLTLILFILKTITFKVIILNVISKMQAYIRSNEPFLNGPFLPLNAHCPLAINQRTNGPVNAHLISGPTVSTKTTKIGQGQPRVIIYINFVELESPMLDAKSQDHRTSGAGEEDFKGFII